MPRPVVTWWVAAVATLALALVVVLGVQNGRLRAELSDLRYRSLRPQAGDVVPTFVAPTLSGDTVRIVTGVPSARQVLVVFTTTCQYCQRSIAAWHDLARRLALEGVGLVGISLDSPDDTRHFRDLHAIGYPIVRFPNEGYRRMYRANSVPITMVIDGDGLVVYARMGVIEADAACDSVMAAVQWRPVAAGRREDRAGR